ncbi:hypothetical protein JCM3774_006763 [Rhodotorula dairenensis]
MACRVGFRALLRPTRWHTPQQRVAAAAAPPLPPRAHLSHAATLRSAAGAGAGAGAEQASWDSIDDDAAAFQRATEIQSSPDRSAPLASPSAPRRTRVYATRARQQILEDLPLRVQRGTTPSETRKKKPRPEPAPELPPLEPLPALDALHPTHLSDLRLWVLRRTGHTPTTNDLEGSLAAWLRTTRATEARERDREQRQLELRAAKREALDLSWEWDRQVALKSGIERTDRERHKDQIVLARLERRRIDKLERARQEALDRERTEREQLDALVRKREQEVAELKAAEAAAAAQAAARLKRAPEWKKHQVALREQFPTGWAPPKRLSREAMDLVRTMHAANPDLYSTAALAAQFKVSPEAVRRILKSRFEITKQESDRREARRKEARKREVAQGASSVWGGDVAAEAREMESIRRTGGETSRRQREE